MVKFALALLGLAAMTEAFTSSKSSVHSSSTSLNLYGKPRKVQIIPSVLPADCKVLVSSTLSMNITLAFIYFAISRYVHDSFAAMCMIHLI